MSELAKMFIGIMVIAAPFVLHLHYYLGKLSCAMGGKCPALTEQQKAHLRTGRATLAGLIAIAILGEYLLDFTAMNAIFTEVVRYTFPISVFVVALGYHLGAKNKGASKPQKCCHMGCLGYVGFYFSCIALGIGLL